MMKEIVCAIIADVAKNTTAEDCRGNIPVPVKNCVGQLVERGGEDNE